MERGPDAPRISVVVRAKDEAASIGRTLGGVAAQTARRRRVEVIVVDSGSTDATVAIARAAGARVIGIPAGSFTFGGSLNTGCEAARGEIVVALSAHAFPRDEQWLERMLEPFADPLVACAVGDDHGPDRRPLRDRVVQDLALARRQPMWGYSNAAGAFRRSLWLRRPFRPDMPGTEDKEWAWHWLERGLRVVVDPALCVDHSHGRDPARSLFERSRREWEGLGMFVDLEPFGWREAVAQWWREQDAHRTRMRALLSHRRAARLAGRVAGQRAATRSRYSAA